MTQVDLLFVITSNLLFLITFVLFFSAVIVGHFGKTIAKGSLHDENYDESIPTMEKISRLERAGKYFGVAVLLSIFAFIVALINTILVFTKVNT